MLMDRKGSYPGKVRLALWALASGLALSLFSGMAMASTPIFREAKGGVALVVGNSAYRHAAELANPGNDATAMAEALGRLNFEVMLGLDLDRSSFVEKLKEFRSATAGASVSLFFYAGYASQYQGENYLMPIDATEVEDPLDYKSHIELNEYVMYSMRSRTKLVFLDSCFDNLLDEGFRTRRAVETGSASNLRGLASVRSQTGGWHITYATAPGSVAGDGPPGGHSPFTAALLKHISTPNLSVSDLMARVSRSVLRSTNGGQMPWTMNSLLEPFFFSRSEVAPALR